MSEADLIRQQNSLVETASRYIELVRKGSDYVGLCPFHDDSRPSLNIYTGRDGVERFICFACQAAGDVIDFVGDIEGVDYKSAVRKLTGGELPASGAPIKRRPKRASEESLWTPIVPVPADAPEYDPQQTYNPKAGKMRFYRPTRIDPYYDAEGSLMFYVVRLDFNGEKITPMVTWCEGPEGRRLWCSRYVDKPWPLCGLDQLAERPSDAVLVVSGEKCYQYALEHIPTMVPVTWPGGDDGLRHTDISPLKDRWVTCWPDADWSGGDACLSLFNRLQRL